MTSHNALITSDSTGNLNCRFTKAYVLSSSAHCTVYVFKYNSTQKQIGSCCTAQQYGRYSQVDFSDFQTYFGAWTGIGIAISNVFDSLILYVTILIT